MGNARLSNARSSPDFVAAKPTKYNGITFRSCLEARWAYFYDLLKIPWEYEPEWVKDTLNGSGLYYMPDFYIRLGGGFYIEIKGPYPSYDEKYKAAKLATITHKAVLIFYGSLEDNRNESTDSALFLHEEKSGVGVRWSWLLPTCQLSSINSAYMFAHGARRG